MQDTRPSTPTRRYEEAHQLHYGSKDLQAAFELYMEILVTDQGTPEAGYARSQIHNIVRSVVPEQALFDTQVELAGKYFQQLDTAPPKPATVSG